MTAVAARWFRFYNEALDDPKVQRLSGDLFKTWVNLLALASQRGGRLPSRDDIAFRLRISHQDAEARVSELVLAELVDILPDGGLQPHNWEGRQFASDGSAERTRKYRKNKAVTRCDGERDVTVTVQNQNQKQIEDFTSLPLPEQEAARATKDREVKASLKSFGGKSEVGRGSGRLEAKAEGLGVPVAELRARTAAAAPRNPEAYFRALCVSWLKNRVPSAGEELIRRALSGNAEAYTLLVAALISGLDEVRP